MRWQPKDPGETLDYTHSFAAFLDDGDTVSTVTWTVRGATKGSESTTTTSGTVFVSGGVHGTEAVLTSVAVTASGRTIKRVSVLPIQKRN